MNTGVANIAKPQRNKSPYTLGFMLIYLSLLDLVFIRFFTEKLHLLPRLAQLLFPVSTALIFVYAVLIVMRRGRLKLSSMTNAIVAFLALAFVSAFANMERISLMSVGLSVFSWLSPLIFFIAIQWLELNQEEIARYLKSYFIFGLVQFPVVFLYDYPKFLSTKNPDDVSGTFGYNSYQLIFFISLWLFIFLSKKLYAGDTKSFGPKVLMIGATALVFVVFFLAQYLSMLAAFPLTIAFFLIAQPGKKMGKTIVGLVVLALFVSLFKEIDARFPQLKLGRVYEKLQKAEIDKIGKVRLLNTIPKIYFEEAPHFGFIGTGPGTYASRAAQAVSGTSATSSSRTNIFADSDFNLASYHISDVALKYIAPIYRSGIQIGTTPDNPQMSFVAIFVEYGALGGLLIYGMYGAMLYWGWSSMRLARARRDETLYVLAGAALGGGMILLEMGFLGTFLESSRVTIPMWIVFGLLYRYRRIVKTG